ncbi:MAG TPA: DNA-formamidopyrimidine glycosylase family protein [Candidatus Limnocylindrales bacterium]
MPELPDLAIVADALHAALAGRLLTAASTPDPLVVRGTPDELGSLVDLRVERVRRLGKFLLVDLDRGRIVFNPMLTGRFQLADPSAKPPSRTAMVLRFGPRTGGPADAAAWTRGAEWLPADAAEAEVRYRDPTRMGKVYLEPAGVSRPIAGLGPGEQGPEIDAPELTVDVWRTRIRRHPGELKNMLKNQAFVAGLGNAYSDEVLHAARLLPFRTRRSLSAEEVDALYDGARSTVSHAIDVLRERVPPTFETQVRDFLAVHGKGGQACPRCGTRITEIAPGGFVTSYCRGCQF